MSDITKCNNEKCKSKNKCYRYTSEDSEYQIYSEFGNTVNCEKCECFIDND